MSRLPLFEIYSNGILIEPEALAGFINNRHHLNNIRYADDTVSTADSERLQILLDRVVEESGRQKKTDYQMHKDKKMTINK